MRVLTVMCYKQYPTSYVLGAIHGAFMRNNPLRKLVQHRDKKFERMSFHWLFILVCLFSMVSPLSAVFAQPSVDRSLARLESPARPAKLYDSQDATVPLLAPSLIPGSSKLSDGFEMQVVASEPEVQQPIAMAWDAKGRLWIAENYTFAEKKLGFDTQLSDRILVLEDTDGDGKFDSRKVFWDEGKKLTGIEVGAKGIWALAPPNLLFLKDEDEDDVCDGKPQVILNGFNENMRYDMAHGLRFGPDGWLYGMHGTSAVSAVGIPAPTVGQQQYTSFGQPPFVPQEQPRLFSPLRNKATYERFPVHGGIWRFNVNTSEFQVYCNSSINPTGMDWDRYGNLFFVASDSREIWHALPNTHHQFKFGKDADPSTHYFLPRVANLIQADTAKEIPAGNQGILICSADQWPASYRNQVLLLNNHDKHLQRCNLERKATSFIGDRQDDFVKWHDPWFRGMELSTGPDGSLYVLDGSELGDAQDTDGVHRHSGRIYRIKYNGSDISGQVPSKDIASTDTQTINRDLTGLTNEDLVNLIHHPNYWNARMSQRLFASTRRFTIQQLQAVRKILFSKAQPASIVASNVEPTVIRLRALWLLHNSGNLDSRTVVQLIRGNPPDELLSAAVKLIADESLGNEVAEDSEVYEEILDSLGTLVSTKSGTLTKLYLAALQSRLNPNDWRLPTLLSQSKELVSSVEYVTVIWHWLKTRVAIDPMGAAKLCGKSKLPSLTKLIVRLLAWLHVSDPEPIAWVVGDATISGSKEHLAAVVEGMSEGYANFRSAEAPKAWDQLRKKVDAGNDETTRIQARMLEKIFGSGLDLDYLIRAANDPGAELASRRLAIQSIANHSNPDATAELWKLLHQEELVATVAKAIAAIGTESDAAMLVDAYPRFGEEGKKGIVAALASQPRLLEILLEAVESHKIPAEEVDAASWIAFKSVGEWDWLERARKLSPSVLNLSEEKKNEIELIERELTEADLKTGDTGRGRVVWEKTCAKCHTLFDSGGEIGPNLTNAPRRNLKYLLENIVVPYEQVAVNDRVTLFQNQEAAIVPGILLAESKETITIQTETEKWTARTHEILRRTPSSHSLMPEGLLNNLQTSSRLDLLSYLMSEQQVAIPLPPKKTKAP